MQPYKNGSALCRLCQCQKVTSVQWHSFSLLSPENNLFLLLSVDQKRFFTFFTCWSIYVRRSFDDLFLFNSALPSGSRSRCIKRRCGRMDFNQNNSQKIEDVVQSYSHRCRLFDGRGPVRFPCPAGDGQISRSSSHENNRSTCNSVSCYLSFFKWIQNVISRELFLNFRTVDETKKSLCANLVDVTGACQRRKRGMDKPIILSFDNDDIDLYHPSPVQQ